MFISLVVSIDTFLKPSKLNKSLLHHYFIGKQPRITIVDCSFMPVGALQQAIGFDFNVARRDAIGSKAVVFQMYPFFFGRYGGLHSTYWREVYSILRYRVFYGSRKENPAVFIL